MHTYNIHVIIYRGLRDRILGMHSNKKLHSLHSSSAQKQMYIYMVFIYYVAWMTMNCESMYILFYVYTVHYIMYLGIAKKNNNIGGGCAVHT